MKKAIFFDFFGVICCEIAPFWFRRHFSPEEAARVKEEICSRADAGEILEDEFHREISARTGVAPDVVAREMQEMICINGELRDFILRLRERYPVYLLSNAMSSFLRRILEENDLYPLFDRVFISAEMRVAKPSPDFFRAVLASLSLDGADVVMIDDNEKNLAGAADAGIDGILFTENGPFYRDLAKYYDIDGLVK